MGWRLRSLAEPRDDRGVRVSTVAVTRNDPSRSALEILRCSRGALSTGSRLGGPSRGGCSICDSTSGPYPHAHTSRASARAAAPPSCLDKEGNYAKRSHSGFYAKALSWRREWDTSRLQRLLRFSIGRASRGGCSTCGGLPPRRGLHGRMFHLRQHERGAQ